MGWGGLPPQHLSSSVKAPSLAAALPDSVHSHFSRQQKLPPFDVFMADEPSGAALRGAPSRPGLFFFFF